MINNLRKFSSALFLLYFKLMYVTTLWLVPNYYILLVEAFGLMVMLSYLSKILMCTSCERCHGCLDWH